MGNLLAVARHPIIPATPRLFEGGKFHHQTARRTKFHAYDYRPPGEDVDAESIRSFSRVAASFFRSISAARKTGRIPALVKAIPRASCASLHPLLAAKLGIKTATSSR
jgi:hypothetical protein